MTLPVPSNRQGMAQERVSAPQSAATGTRPIDSSVRIPTDARLLPFRRMKRPRSHAEDNIQAALFKHIDWRGVDGLIALHCPNGGRRNKHEAARLKGMGVRAGAPDVFLFHGGRSFALELKTLSGRLRDSQSAFLDKLTKAGVTTSVARGLDQALWQLEQWGLLRGS